LKLSLAGPPFLQLLAFAAIWVLGSFGVFNFRSPRDAVRTSHRPGALAYWLALGNALALTAVGTAGIYCSWAFGPSRALHAGLLVAYAGAGLLGFVRFNGWSEQHKASWFRSPSRSGLAVLLPFVVMAPAVVTPCIGGDDYAYHVSIIRHWFEAPSLKAVDFLSTFAFPMLGSEMAAVFAPAFGLVGAKMTQFAFAGTTALGLYGVVALLTRRRSLAAVSAFFFVALPVHFTWAYVAMADRSTACLIFLGSTLLLDIPAVGAPLRFVGGATLLAAAASTKHCGAIALLAFGLASLVACRQLRAPSVRRSWALASAAGLSAALVLAPWYGRAFLQTGEAFFPFRSSNAEYFSLEGRGARSSGDLIRKRLTLSDVILQVAPYRRADAFNSEHNPVLLVLLPLIAAAGLRMRRSFPAGTAALVVMVAAFLALSAFFPTARQYRTYLYPIEAPILLLGGLSARALRLTRFGERVLWSVAWMLFLFLGHTAGLHLSQTLPHFLGVTSKEIYLAQNHAFGWDVVLVRSRLTRQDRVVDNAGLIELCDGCRITRSQRAPGEFFVTKKALKVPGAFEDAAQAAAWLRLVKHTAIVTLRERCPGVEHWPRTEGVQVLAGRRLVLVKLLS
jgi:hypothetical protein